MTFNGTASTTASFGINSIQRISRPLYPGSRARTQTITGRDGVYFHSKDRQEIYISVRFLISSTSLANKRTAIRAIAAWLDVDEPKVLTFDDESTKRYYAIPIDEINVDEVVYLGFADMTFLVPAGYAESTTTKTASPNAGTLKTPVEITATMVADSASLKIDCGDEHILLTTALVIGDEIIIDTNTRYVTLNGVDVRGYVSFGSDYFKLPVGAFTVTPTPASTTLAIVYRERFK